MPDKPGLNYPEPGTAEALERANRIRARQAQGMEVNPNNSFMLKQGIAEIGAKLRRPPRFPLGGVPSTEHLDNQIAAAANERVAAARAEEARPANEAAAALRAEQEANRPPATRLTATNIGGGSRLSIQKNGDNWTPYNKAEGREYEPTESIGDTGATPRMLDGGMYTNERHKDFYDKAFSDGEESGTSQMALDGYLQDHGIRVTSKNGWEGALSEYQTKYGLEATGQMDDQTKAHIKASLKSAEEIRNDITNSSRTL